MNGARQTGKTYILKEFGKREYANLHYFNFEEEPQLVDLFAQSLNPEYLINQLSLFEGQTISANTDLIFFDEVQLCNNALNSLKYFCENAPEYHVVSAGSLLGLQLSGPKSFPVGKVNMLKLTPMTMLEFLTACGESSLREMVEQTGSVVPFPGPFHNRLTTCLRSYYFVGGMPEAVSVFAQTKSFEAVREVHREILGAFVRDFAKHAPGPEIPKLSIIWNSIPAHLARENKKFIYSALAGSARAREYENAIQWLVDAGLILQAFAVNHVGQPVSGFANRNAFKVYALDVGLLSAMANMPAEILVQGDEIFTTYKGALAENYAAQQLLAQNDAPLHYWKPEKGIAEIDFLLDFKARIYPLEVKAGINSKSKSMAVYAGKYAPDLKIRSTLLNLRRDAGMLNIPLYAVNCVEKYISAAIQESR